MYLPHIFYHFREKKHFSRWLPTEKVAILTFQRQDTEFLTQGKKHTEIMCMEGGGRKKSCNTVHIPSTVDCRIYFQPFLYTIPRLITVKFPCISSLIDTFSLHTV